MIGGGFLTDEEYRGKSFDDLPGDDIEEKPEHECTQDKDIAMLTGRTESFERWQQIQNGSIQRLEKKLDVLIDRLDNKLDALAKDIRDISNRISAVEGFKVGRAEAENLNIGKWRIRQDRVALYVAAAAGIFTLLNVVASFIPRFLGW